MENSDVEFVDDSHDSQIVVTYRHKDGMLAYRIPQRDLERVFKLEQLLETARHEIDDRIRQGFKEETGELIIDRDAYRADAMRRIVRPARARAGRSPRVFVLSSRERRFVQAWARGEHGEHARAFRIIDKLERRTRMVLRRECQMTQLSQSWDQIAGLASREIRHRNAYFKLRVLQLGLRLGIDTRSRIGTIFDQQLLAFQRKC